MTGSKNDIYRLALKSYFAEEDIGFTVQIYNSEKQTVTDEKGNYILTEITPDRYDIKISFEDYKEVIIPNVIVTSGKEVILDQIRTNH